MLATETAIGTGQEMFECKFLSPRHDTPVVAQLIVQQQLVPILARERSGTIADELAHVQVKPL